MSLFAALVKFCPRCGERLTKADEPAACENCGWQERPPVDLGPLADFVDDAGDEAKQTKQKQTKANG